MYPQSPYNGLNYVLFILNFMYVDACEKYAVARFWHDDTPVTVSQVKWKDICTGY